MNHSRPIHSLHLPRFCFVDRSSFTAKSLSVNTPQTKHVGWSSLLGARRKSANRIVRELVLARLSQPESKRATVDALANQVGITFSLDSVYRSMDFLDTAVIDKLCRISHEATKNLLGQQVDVLFYDCTTLAFDTEREDDQADEKTDRLF